MQISPRIKAAILITIVGSVIFGVCFAVWQFMPKEMKNSFLSDFLANFFADFLVTVGFGAFLTWWIGKQLSVFERSQQRREEKRAELRKAISYLELLKDEIDPLIDQLPDLVGQTGWVREIRTPFWDILQPSGELPKLLDPHMLQWLALFYECSRSGAGRKQLLQFENGLQGKLDSEIQRLKAKLQEL